jgi:nitrate reductase gamma subunit
MTEQTIGGANKGSEVAWLFETFSFSCVAVTFAGSWWRYDLASALVTQTSTIQLVMRSQRPHRRMSPLLSLLAGFALVLLVGQTFTLGGISCEELL